MADISSSIFFNFFLYLFIPFVLAIILKKNKISPIIGYMLGGIILSNVFINQPIDQGVIRNFAYFGIVLLLFTVGLETQFERLIVIRKFIVFGGLFQILFSIISIGLVSLIFDFSFVQSILIGIALSSSSTTLVAKIIEERGEESSFLGEVAIGILVFQDLAFIPFVIIFTSLTGIPESPFEITKKIILDVVSSAGILLIAYYFGKKIIPIIFNKIARISRELLNLFIIVFIFFVAYVSSLLKVPIMVSVFVSGILIAQTLEHYHIFSQIRPLRDLLAIFFFIFIGSTVKIANVSTMLPQIIAFTMIVVFIKAIIIMAIFLALKFGSKLSFNLGSFLFQIDEDAFILMSLAYANKIFTEDQYLFIITVVLLSLVVTPLVIYQREVLYKFVRNFIKKSFPSIDHYITYRIDSNHTAIDVLDIKNHVIICGYGRIGSYIGRALMLANISFIAVDYNFHIVERAKQDGINIIYGDPTDINIQDYLEVERARIVIIAVPDYHSQEAVVLNIKKLNPNVPIICRVHRKSDYHRIKDLGVEIIIQPEFEASLSILKKILLMQPNLSKEEIIKKLHYFKLEQEGI